MGRSSTINLHYGRNSVEKRQGFDTGLNKQLRMSHQRRWTVLKSPATERAPHEDKSVRNRCSKEAAGSFRIPHCHWANGIRHYGCFIEQSVTSPAREGVFISVQYLQLLLSSNAFCKCAMILNPAIIAHRKELQMSSVNDTFWTLSLSDLWSRGKKLKRLLHWQSFGIRIQSRDVWC